MNLNPVIPPEYILLFSVIVLAAGGAACWYSTTGCTFRVRFAALVLRMAAVALITLAALNPGSWQHIRESSIENWCVLVDLSRSMDVTDAGASQTRLQKAGETARGLVGLSNEERHFGLYAFSDIAEPVDEAASFSDEKAGDEGKGTSDILGAVDTVLNRYGAAENLKGIFVLSDGRQIPDKKDDDAAALRALARSVPIYSVCYGGGVENRDIELLPLRRRQTSFSGQTVRLSACLSNSHMGNIGADIRLLDAVGKILGTQQVNVENNGRAEIPFEVTAGSPGYYEYRFSTAVRDGEQQAGNNEAWTGLTVLGEKIKVLFLEGIPHWDSKFLTRLLQEQPHMAVTAVVKVSPERFLRVETGGAKASVGEAPDAGADAFLETPGDTPGTSHSDTSYFPESLAELSQYDIIILGKGAEYFLTPPRLNLLKTFISEYGGGLILSRAKPYTVSLPDFESLEPVKWGRPLGRSIRWRPTPEGEAAGLFGHMLPGINDPVWEKLPGISRAYRCPETGNFSRVLIAGEMGEAGSPVVPVLVSRRFGRGMVAALNSEGLWKWDFFPDSAESGALYEQFWNHLIQWTAFHGDYLPGQEYSLRLGKNAVAADEPLRAVVRKRNRAGDEPAPVLHIRRGKETVQTIHFRSSGQQMWETGIRLSEPGIYRVEAAVGGNLTLSRMLAVAPPAAETDNLSAEPAFLERLSRISGGRMIRPGECAGIIRDEKAEAPAAPEISARWVSAWDRWFLLIGIIACLGGEWHIRRRNGLL